MGCAAILTARPKSISHQRSRSRVVLHGAFRYDPPMLARFQRYWINVGPVHALMSFFVLGNVLWIEATRATTFEGAVALIVMLIAMLGPGLFVGVLVRHWSIVIRAINLFWPAAVGLLLANMFRLWAMPPAAILACAILLFMAMGAQFWCLSDHRLVTKRAIAYYRARAAREAAQGGEA